MFSYADTQIWNTTLCKYNIPSTCMILHHFLAKNNAKINARKQGIAPNDESNYTLLPNMWFFSVNLTSCCANCESLPSATIEILVNISVVPKIFGFGQVVSITTIDMMGRRKKTKQVLRNYQSYSIDLFSEQLFRDSPPGGGNDHEPLRGTDQEAKIRTDLLYSFNNTWLCISITFQVIYFTPKI